MVTEAGLTDCWMKYSTTIINKEKTMVHMKNIVKNAILLSLTAILLIAAPTKALAANKVNCTVD